MRDMCSHPKVQDVCSQASINHFLSGRVINSVDFELIYCKDVTLIISKDTKNLDQKIFEIGGGGTSPLLCNITLRPTHLGT